MEPSGIAWASLGSAEGSTCLASKGTRTWGHENGGLRASHPVPWAAASLLMSHTGFLDLHGASVLHSNPYLVHICAQHMCAVTAGNSSLTTPDLLSADKEMGLIEGSESPKISM